MTPEVEKITPYGSNESKTGQVEQMFDSIAPAYDFMNTAMTFGLHRWWRNRALARLKNKKLQNVLDVATGTGDVAFAIANQLKPQKIVGLDLSAGMLEIARRRLAKTKSGIKSSISFEQGDSLHMRFENDSFDAITVAYGVRNFEHLEQGLREMARVLSPGGTLCIVELSVPANPIIRTLYNFYAKALIPAIGRLISGDTRAYTYLPESIARTPQRTEMTQLMSRAGLQKCKWQSLTFGVVCIYTATK